MATSYHDNGVPMTTGIAKTPEGKTLCYPCADSWQSAAMSAAGQAGESFGVYLSSDGRNLTTWTGGVLARVTDETFSRYGAFGRYPLTYVTARDASGRVWHGKGSGRGMSLTIRPVKYSAGAL